MAASQVTGRSPPFGTSFSNPELESRHRADSGRSGELFYGVYAENEAIQKFCCCRREDRVRANMH